MNSDLKGLDAWLTNAPDGHEEDSCESCHQSHIDKLAIINNYELFDCCTEEVDSWIEKGDWCGIKIIDHGEQYMENGVCTKCEEEADT